MLFILYIPTYKTDYVSSLLGGAKQVTNLFVIVDNYYNTLLFTTNSYELFAIFLLWRIHESSRDCKIKKIIYNFLRLNSGLITVIEVFYNQKYLYFPDDTSYSIFKSLNILNATYAHLFHLLDEYR